MTDDPIRVRAGLPRLVEATVSLLGLVAISPILLPAMLAVRLSSPGPVFFRQQRVGRKGATFTLYKLRSMRVDAAGPAVTGREDSRITPVGLWLRKSKLDEFPQLWNVVRGDMSLVGPRPEVQRYTDLANPLWRGVLEARPGITDPLTLKLRDEESLLPADESERERFYLDTLQPLKLRGYLEYLGRRNAWTDVGVIIATVIGILRRPPPVDPAEVLRRGRI